MAQAKVVGIETEYGIAQGRGAADPVAGSSMLVNAYAAQLAGKIRWDFNDESPANDARGRPIHGSFPPMVETHLANTVLTNGARFYVDHAHPEYSSPECRSPLEAVRYDRAGERVLALSMIAAAAHYPGAPELVVYKNNSDGKGNSYGCHENYLVDRTVAFGEVIDACVPHLVTRQIFCGAGKVGWDLASLDPGNVPFQLSQRAEFFEEVVGLETTLKRPIVNTRDEPHADSKRYRRLHLIVGDANMSEVATFLKLGTTAVVLAMLEDRFLPAGIWLPADPVRALQQISADPSLDAKIELADGRRVRALDVQWAHFEAAVRYRDVVGLDAIGPESETNLLLERWEQTLTDLDEDPMRLAATVDWVAKHRLIEGYRERHSLGWGDMVLKALDLQYHDVRPAKSLAARVGLESLISIDDVELAITEPPRGTRAYFRGMCLTKFANNIESANWDSVVFDLGVDPLRRVPMMDPLRGTAAHTEALFASCDSAVELLERLNG